MATKRRKNLSAFSILAFKVVSLVIVMLADCWLTGGQLFPPFETAHLERRIQLIGKILFPIPDLNKHTRRGKGRIHVTLHVFKALSVAGEASCTHAVNPVLYTVTPEHMESGGRQTWMLMHAVPSLRTYFEHMTRDHKTPPFGIREYEISPVSSNASLDLCMHKTCSLAKNLLKLFWITSDQSVLIPLTIIFIGFSAVIRSSFNIQYTIYKW